MANELKTFNSPIFGTIEILTLNGKEYFPASKVATLLGYSNPRDAIARHCVTDIPYVVKYDVGVQTGIKSDGSPAFQTVKTTFIDEGNLYRLIVKSKLPQAQQFERWVFDEVLPMIRKTGAYFTENVWDMIYEDPRAMGELIIKYADEREKRMNAEQKVEELTPSANKWDNWISSKNLYTVHQASHILGIKGMGLKNLFKYFRNNGFVSDENLAFRQYQDQGLFRVKELDTITKNGYRYHRFQTFLTPKGIDYFKERLLSEGYTDLDFVGEPEGFISDYVAA